VVVLELDASGWDACRLAAALRKQQRTLSIIGLCDEGDLHTAERAFRAGVRCVVSRRAPMTTLLQALRADSDSAPLVHLHPDGPRLHEDQRVALTSRQLEVLRLVGAGYTTREISARLGVSAKTVEHHKQNIFKRLGVHNQAHAVSIAMRRGLVGSGIGHTEAVS
jgi:DNA-binding NarL/FixJ family response regulator